MDRIRTIRDALDWGSRRLAAAGNRNPRMDAEVILGMALSLDRTALFSRPETSLDQVALESFTTWIELREKHYPIQYIRGSQEFFGRDFAVEPGVLIPRPETELVVETCLQLTSHAEQSPTGFRILDIGTGTGCIAITLLAENKLFKAAATDINPSAAAIALRNAKALLEEPSRLLLFVSDLAGCLAPGSRFDLVVSNPPYIGSAETEGVDPSVKLYEPWEALFCGETGLEFFARIFRETPPLLAPGGRLVVEIGAGQQKHLEKMGNKEGWILDSTHTDLAGIPRCTVFARRENRF